jgi:hypothetical protein
MYFDIVDDAKNNEVAKQILLEIKTYATRSADKNFRTGEITKIVLNKLLDKIISDRKNGTEDLFASTIIKEMLLKKYLGITDEVHEDVIPLKIK